VAVSELLNRIQQEISGYNGLSAEEVDDEIHITGKLDIGLGEEDKFDVLIVLGSGYPKTIPRTYETGGRVPREMDRHYYTGDGASCCLCMPHLLRQRFPEGAPISVYIDRLVVPYFQNQVHYEITGKYVSEYSHGLLGIYEYYTELFGVKDLETIVRLVQAVVSHGLGGARPCPCGGLKKQRKCHLNAMKELRRTALPNFEPQLKIDVENFKDVLSKGQRVESATPDNKQILA